MTKKLVRDILLKPSSEGRSSFPTLTRIASLYLGACKFNCISGFKVVSATSDDIYSSKSTSNVKYLISFCMGFNSPLKLYPSFSVIKF